MDGGEKQNFSVLNSDEISNLIAQYDTKYFLWTGVLQIHFKNEPGLVNMLKYIQGTVYYCIVFNIETGQIIQKDFKIIEKTDISNLINKYVDVTKRDLMEK